MLQTPPLSVISWHARTGDWWLGSSLYALTHPLVLSVVSVLCKWQGATCRLVHQTWADRWARCSPYSASLHFIQQVHIPPPGPCSHEPVAHGEFGPGYFPVSTAVVRNISRWLDQSWIPPLVCHPWIYGVNWVCKGSFSMYFPPQFIQLLLLFPHQDGWGVSQWSLGERQEYTLVWSATRAPFTHTHAHNTI